MSDTILFPAHQTTQELMNGSMLDMANKAIQEHPLVEKFDSKDEAKIIADLKSGNDWYQKDLSHMTKSLMQEASNTTALTRNNNQIQDTNVVIDNKQSVVVQSYLRGSPIIMGYYGNEFLPLPTVYARLLADDYRDIIGQEPKDSEITSLANAARKSSYLKPEADKIVYSPEAYNRIFSINRDILGYNVDNYTITAQQDKLAQINFDFVSAQGGKISKISRVYTVANLRYDLAYSQAGYDAIANMGSAISGIDLANVDYGQTWIRSVQDRLADPNVNYSLSQERYNYAHSDFVYGLIANNTNRIFGYDWGG